MILFHSFQLNYFCFFNFLSFFFCAVLDVCIFVCLISLWFILENSFLTATAFFFIVNDVLSDVSLWNSLFMLDNHPLEIFLSFFALFLYSFWTVLIFWRSSYFCRIIICDLKIMIITILVGNFRKRWILRT